MTHPPSNENRDLKHLYDCILPNEYEPITKRRINDWLGDFSVVAATHGIEEHIAPGDIRHKETNPDDTNGPSKWKEYHKWLFTILCKLTKGKSVGKTIRPLKYTGSEAYNDILDYVDKYGAEGGAMTAAYD